MGSISYSYRKDYWCNEDACESLPSPTFLLFPEICRNGTLALKGLNILSRHSFWDTWAGSAMPVLAGDKQGAPRLSCLLWLSLPGTPSQSTCITHLWSTIWGAGGQCGEAKGHRWEALDRESGTDPSSSEATQPPFLHLKIWPSG